MNTGLEVFVVIQTMALWVLTLCSAVVGYQHQHLRGSVVFRNVGILPHNTTWRHSPEDLDLKLWKCNSYCDLSFEMLYDVLYI